MNCPEELAGRIHYDILMGESVKNMEHIMGYAEGLYSYDTLQFNDYSKYNCDLFDPAHKKEMREKQFPKDMERAFELGKRLVEMKF